MYATLHRTRMLGLGLKGCFFPYQLPLLSPHCLLSSSSANSASKSVSESPLSAASSSLDIPCTASFVLSPQKLYIHFTELHIPNLLKRGLHLLPCSGQVTLHFFSFSSHLLTSSPLCPKHPGCGPQGRRQVAKGARLYTPPTPRRALAVITSCFG
jgi:hypothetical protein